MPILPYRFQLDHNRAGRGLSCDEGGVFLAGVPLLARTALGFEPRTVATLSALLAVAYRPAIKALPTFRLLDIVAQALNVGDVALAQIAAVHLRLPELDVASAARLRRLNEDLAKYDPNEPRDWRGRWTTEDDASGRTPPLPSPDSAAGATPAKSAGEEGGPSRPTGGHLVPTDADPDSDDETPEGEPLQDPDRPPPEERAAGWETPEGLVPRLPGGELWPQVEPRRMLRLQDPPPTGGAALSYIWIPGDGRGPMLMGMTDTKEFVEPFGYDKVTFIGTPQATYSGGVVTKHALESMKAALQLARTNRYSMIYFNSTLTTGTSGEINSALRPDVLAVVRPGMDYGYRFWPYQSLSPRQNPEDRMRQLKGFSGLNILQWNAYYKILTKLLGSMDLSF